MVALLEVSCGLDTWVASAGYLRVRAAGCNGVTCIQLSVLHVAMEGRGVERTAAAGVAGASCGVVVRHVDGLFVYLRRKVCRCL